MWIEQSDNNEYFEKKRKRKELQEREDFFESQKLKNKTSLLLQSLAKEISVKFGIDIIEVKNLIENKTSSGLDDLKKSLWNNEIDIEEFLADISDATKQVEQLSKKFREELKNSIVTHPLEPNKHNYQLSHKLFSDSFIHQIQNPKSISDNLLWAGIGIIDSSEAVIFFLYWLWKWILLTPYHIYLLLQSKAKIKL